MVRSQTHAEHATVDGRGILHEVDATGREVLRRSDWPLGLEVRQAREAARLSLRAAARGCSFSVNAWSTLETGLAAARNNPGRHRAVNPSGDVIREAAKMLKQPVNVWERWLALAGHEVSVLSPAHRPAGAVAKKGALPSDREILNMLAVIPEYVRVPLVETIVALHKLAVDRDYAAKK